MTDQTDHQIHIRYRLEYALGRTLLFLARRLPRSRWPALGAFLGELAYRLLPRRRKITLENLRRAFGKTGPDPEKTAREAFRALGMSVMEFLSSMDQNRDDLLRKVRVDGFDHFERALEKGRGVIFLASHYGNWELLSLIHSARGYPSHIVARPLDNPWLSEMITRQRERFGSTVISSKGTSSLRQILSALHQKKTVAFLIDQNVVGDRGVYVDFFGRPAYTHKVLGLVASKTEAPVIPVFIDREPGGWQRVTYREPLRLIKTRDRQRDLRIHTQIMAHSLEQEIRASPEQWLWMHDRWKKQPPETRGAVFLDRDGTISKEVGYIRRSEALELLPRSAEAIGRLNRRGTPVVVVTNQSGVARGYFSEEDVGRTHERLAALLRTEGATLDGLYYCPHHPTEGFGEYMIACHCRKPEPGMLYQAASEMGLDLHSSFVVGDKWSDVELAHRVGARAVLVRTGHGESEAGRDREANPGANAVVSDLGEAVDWILDVVRNREGTGDGRAALGGPGNDR